VSKRTITRWYIGAWLVWVISLAALVVMAHSAPESLGRSFVTLVMVVSGLTTLYMWVRALIKLARRHATFSFVSILLLQLMGLGIVGMVAYALSGPEDKVGYVTRPSVT
jgi:predicted Na+-dependent transporter